MSYKPLLYRLKIYYLLALLLIFSLLNTNTFAENIVYESFISTQKDNLIEFTGSLVGAQLGASISSGDYNGDNIDDLLISAPFASINEKKWNGAVYMILGKSVSEQKDIDVSSTSTDMMIIYGDNSEDQLGTSLTSGDFNNDHFDDFAIGAYNAYKNDIRTGKVYIFYGNSTMSSQTVDLALEKADFELTGEHANDGFGLSVSSVDFNNDKTDDLLIGAPFSYISEFTNSGAVYGYLGSSKGFSSLYKLLFYGESEMERFGSSVSGGDINADNKNDVVIGAYFSNNDIINQAGKVYVYSDIDFSSSIISNPSFTISGTKENEWLGFSIAMGDVNGDYIDDLGVTSFPFNGDNNDAKVSMFYGNQIFDNISDFTIDGSINNNSTDESLLGSTLIIEDLDSDKQAELLIGSPGVKFPVSNDAGNAYVIYDNISDQNIISILDGENSDDWFSYSADILDFNGDSYQDLAISSRYFDTENGKNNGKVYVLFGNGTQFGYTNKTDYEKDNEVSRGEFVSIIIEKFDIKNNKAEEINKCYEYKDFCLFNFLAMSSYDDIKLDPQIILYPDIGVDHEYYEDITIATMLGIINGYLNEENSPFRADLPVSRIQALKVMLSAADLVPPKYRFELINILGSLEELQNQSSYFSDIDPHIPYMWWYPRYVNFAFENNIIDGGEEFRPDENITKQELNDMISRTLEFVSSEDNEKVNP